MLELSVMSPSERTARAQAPIATSICCAAFGVKNTIFICDTNKTTFFRVWCYLHRGLLVRLALQFDKQIHQRPEIPTTNDISQALSHLTQNAAEIARVATGFGAERNRARSRWRQRQLEMLPKELICFSETFHQFLFIHPALQLQRAL